MGSPEVSRWDRWDRWDMVRYVNLNGFSVSMKDSSELVGEPRGKFLRPTAHEALHLFRSADLVVGLYHGSEIQRVTVRKPFSHSFIMSYVCIYWFDIF